MSEELKPCPFCGGEAAIYEPITTRFWFVRCSNGDTCSTCGPDRGTRSEAIEAWNTRAERTCKIDGTYDDEFGIYDHLSCGHVAMRQWPEKTNYCPNCGRKVVNDAD